ncbi:MAG: histidine kinase [Gammaproteobacteria bacterium RIFCSPLOWO2_02_FULL_61_13]|nr:MAG: histidine kinase [Gammaproteobacteria bacterium RIFCSPLOWO2_02_FULL_61_13]
MSKTILIVEDNENNMMLVRDVLQIKGYTVLEATTGTEGVRLALAARPDLVLIDIQLPDIDGITVFAQIRANEATKGIPLLAVSASVMPDEKQKIISSGFDAYITKPLNMKSFVETVEKFIGKA